MSQLHLHSGIFNPDLAALAPLLEGVRMTCKNIDHCLSAHHEDSRQSVQVSSSKDVGFKGQQDPVWPVNKSRCYGRLYLQLALTSSTSIPTSLSSFLWFYYLYHSESMSKKPRILLQLSTEMFWRTDRSNRHAASFAAPRHD
ncbi:hypothetical protein AZE42_12799 [Rhizopogon vesiculosus]|uniref:Uncharacterized protein n=1 Tax=Rhizopogon vesiculosus TaxID=180088 RepID=A0A1J8QGU8_9AGAM|nr:hypothetical protein AZE42_12799 [Rhizopogon vesiculosus]